MLVNVFQRSGFLLFDTNCLVDTTGCTGYPKELPVPAYSQTTWPSLSPDNRFILFNAEYNPNALQSHMILLDIQNGKSHPITSLTGSSGFGNWSADGRYITFVGSNDLPDHNINIYLLDVTRGLSQQFIHVPGQNLNFPVWAP